MEVLCFQFSRVTSVINIDRVRLDEIGRTIWNVSRSRCEYVRKREKTIESRLRTLEPTRSSSGKICPPVYIVSPWELSVRRPSPRARSRCASYSTLVVLKVVDRGTTFYVLPVKPPTPGAHFSRALYRSFKTPIARFSTPRRRLLPSPNGREKNPKIYARLKLDTSKTNSNESDVARFADSNYPAPQSMPARETRKK